MYHHRLLMASAKTPVATRRWNPLDISKYSVSDTVDLLLGNSRAVGSFNPAATDFFRHVRSTLPIVGNVYFELGVYGGIQANFMGLINGAVPYDNRLSVSQASDSPPFYSALFYSFAGQVLVNGVTVIAPTGKLNSGDFIGFAVRVGDREMYVRNAAGYFGSGNPTTRANPITIPDYSAVGGAYIYAGPQKSSDAVDYNTDNLPAKFSVPTGYMRV